MDAKDYFKYARKGARIERWSMEPVIRKQTLGEHQYHVAVIYDICWHYVRPTFLDKLYNPELGCAEPIAKRLEELRDVFATPLLNRALNHDAVEYLTGDLNKRVKNQVPELWEKLEKELVKTATSLGQYIDPVDADPLIDFCDAFEALCYCREERNMGNQNLKDAEEYYYSKLTKHEMEKLFGLFTWISKEEIKAHEERMEGLDAR